MELNCLELAFKQKVEADHPTRRVTVGRCAHLTEPTAEHIALGRGPCQLRSMCERGCGYGAYFSSLSATLPAAQKTGNLTIVTDAIVERLDYDHAKRRISGVRVIDANTRQGRSYQARVVFLCASTIGSAQILLASRSEYFPNGLANRSDAVGRYLMDHVVGIGATGTHPGFLDRYYYGRRPTGFYLPRYVNITENDGVDFVRGFGFQGYSGRSSWSRGADEVGVGAELKQRLRNPGRWEMRLVGFGEMLPRADNRVTLHEAARTSGAFRWSTSTARTARTNAARRARQPRCRADARGRRFREHRAASVRWQPPGQCVHEMGTARMGHDPATSVLNRYNQAHDVSNLFVTDGSCMTSSGTRESVADLHGPVGAGGELRRRPAGFRRNLSCSRRRSAPWPGRVGRTRTASSRNPGTRLRRLGVDLGQRETHAGGPGRGFRDDRNPSAVQGAAIYLIGELRTQCLHYCDLPLGRLGAAGARSASVGRRAEIKSADRPGAAPGGPFACLGGVFWA